MTRGQDNADPEEKETTHKLITLGIRAEHFRMLHVNLRRGVSMLDGVRTFDVPLLEW